MGKTIMILTDKDNFGFKPKVGQVLGQCSPHPWSECKDMWLVEDVNETDDGWKAVLTKEV